MELSPETTIMSSPAPAPAANPPAPSAPAAAAPTPSPAAAGAATTTKAAASSGSKSKKSSSKTATKASGAGTTAKKKTSTTKRRKPAKTTSAASQQAIANDARTAAAHLSQQQAKELARRTDPLWYRMEDVIPANMTATDVRKMGVVDEFKVVENALHSHGKTRADVTPQALACMLEHIRRYRQELVSSAKKFAEAAGRADITKADLQLAAELRHDHPVALSSQLPKLNLLASQVNRAPLPPIPDASVKLPPPPFALTARTFDVLSGAATAQKMQMPFPRPPKTTAASAASSHSQQGSYGAIRGRQIPVKLKGAAASAPTPPPAPAPATGATTSTAAPAGAVAGEGGGGSGPTPMDTSESSPSAAPAPATASSTTTAAKPP